MFPLDYSYIRFNGETPQLYNSCRIRRRMDPWKIEMSEGKWLLLAPEKHGLKIDFGQEEKDYWPPVIGVM